MIRIFVACWIAIGIGAAAHAAGPAGEAAAVAKAAQDLCGRRIALLGENGFHGDGRTPEFKVELIRRLVTRCGFDAVFFEASHYEFQAIARHARRHEPVTAAMVSAAIGGMWNRDAELAPLFPFLASGVNSRRLALGGLDDQIGSLGALYANDTMPDELTAFLAPSRRPQCREQFRPQIYFDFPPDAPHSAATRDLLRACFAEAGAAVSRSRVLDRATKAEDLQMVASIDRALARDLAPMQKLIQGRDRSMFLNFRWLADRLPRGSKIIVWAANSHVMKTGAGDPDYDGGADLGAFIHKAYGNRAFALGFSAAGGAFRWGKRQSRSIPPAPPGSLEAVALAGSGEDVVYLGPPRLQRIGTALGGALKAHEYVPARWSNLYDGMIVFRTERPPVRTDE